MYVSSKWALANAFFDMMSCLEVIFGLKTEKSNDLYDQI